MSSSRISYLPPNIFNELPNLKELDLYGNYLKKISVSIIEPLTKLKQINLQNNYWTCNTEFNEFENWLETRKIVHHYQCKPIVKFERLQNFEDIKTESQDKNDELSSREENENEISSREEIDEFSLYEDNSDELCPPSEPNKNDNKENMFTDYTFLMLYNERVPSTISLLIGLQMGIVFGILGTYCWMGKLYKCKPIRLTNHRRLRRMRRQELIAHQQLLSWNNTSFDENYMTPPTLRRSALNTFNARPLNIIENQNSTSNLSCEIDIPVTSTAANTIPGPGRPETPPPTYKDCLKDSVIRTGNN